MDRDLEWARGRHDAWQQAIRERDEVALGALGRVLQGMAAHTEQERLTAREVEVLQLCANGKRTEAVGEALGISRETVKSHLRHVTAKLRAKSQTEAVAIAWRRCLID